METNDQTSYLTEEIPQETPKGLKTLTTLTFIGCGLGYIGSLLSMFLTKDYATQHAQLQEAVEKSGGGTFGKIAQDSLEMVERNQAYIQRLYDNRFLVYGLAIVFITLCLVGAMRMRQQRKSGYPIYLAGELLPILTTGILVGFNLQGWQAWIGLIVPIVFTALYTAQRKHLVRE